MIRREQAERTRETLLDAAAEEFWLHGLEGTRIQDVLDRAGMTKGGLYHHFTNKHEMADALVAGEADSWPAFVEGHASPEVRGVRALESFVLAVAARLEDEIRARAVLRITEELDAPEAVSAFVLWHDVVIRLLQQAIADGEVSDAIAIREVATTVVECVYGVCSSPAPMSRTPGAVDRVESMWRVLGPGLRATGRAQA